MVLLAPNSVLAVATNAQKLLLLMALLEPIIFPAGVTDALGQAHCICSGCCRWPCLGPLVFQQVLSMPKDRPIAFAAASADGLAWAYYFL